MEPLRPWNELSFDMDHMDLPGPRPQGATSPITSPLMPTCRLPDLRQGPVERYAATGYCERILPPSAAACLSGGLEARPRPPAIRDAGRES